jgi:hypothetical protein
MDVITRRVSWGAIFAGVVVALVIQLALGLLGIGIGFGTMNPVDEQNPMQTISIASGIWLIISTLIALFVGGWAAGRLTGSPIHSDGMWHGFVTWVLVTLITFYLLTTAVGSVLNATASALGKGLSMAGQGVSALAPEAAKAAKEQLQEQGITVDKIKQEARELLQQTGKPQLQPENLNQQAQQTAQEAQQGAKSAATTPSNADQDLEQILNRALSRGGTTLEAADKQALVNVIVARTGKSEQEASQIVDRWAQQYQQAAEKLQQLQEKAKQAAAEAADKAAKAISAAALWAFVALVISAVAAIIGGRMGTPRRTI